MISLQELTVEGIRSYKDESTIRFGPNLTLIFGANGAGKTTIIEALKYICTGVPPPNSDGGKSFVRDAQLLNRKTSLGKVRAVFSLSHDQNNSSIFEIERGCSVTEQKDGRRQLKNSEVMTRQNGQLRTSRLADAEKEILGRLKVSKEMLESVLFCHQEEANWPMSEDKKLKERFDDIFASTKYANALDAVEKEASALRSQITSHKLVLQATTQAYAQLQAQRERRKQTENRHIQLKTELKEAQQDLLTKEEIARQLKREFESCEADRMEVMKITERLRLKTLERNKAKAGIDTLEFGAGRRLIELKEEELDNNRNHLLKEIAALEDEAKKLQRHDDQAEGNVRELTKVVELKRNEVAKCEGKMSGFGELCEDARKLVESVYHHNSGDNARYNQQPLYTVSTTLASVGDVRGRQVFLNEIISILHRLQQKETGKKKEIADGENQIQQRLQDALHRKLEIEARLTNGNAAAAENRKKHSILLDEIAKLQLEIESECRKRKGKGNSAEESLGADDIDDNGIEAEYQRLNEELKITEREVKDVREMIEDKVKQIDDDKATIAKYKDLLVQSERINQVYSTELASFRRAISNLLPQLDELNLNALRTHVIGTLGSNISTDVGGTKNNITAESLKELTSTLTTSVTMAINDLETSLSNNKNTHTKHVSEYDTNQQELLSLVRERDILGQKQSTCIAKIHNAIEVAQQRNFVLPNRLQQLGTPHPSLVLSPTDQSTVCVDDGWLDRIDVIVTMACEKAKSNESDAKRHVEGTAYRLAINDLLDEYESELVKHDKCSLCGRAAENEAIRRVIHERLNAKRQSLGLEGNCKGDKQTETKVMEDSVIESAKKRVEDWRRLREEFEDALEAVSDLQDINQSLSQLAPTLEAKRKEAEQLTALVAQAKDAIEKDERMKKKAEFVLRDLHHTANDSMTRLLRVLESRHELELEHSNDIRSKIENIYRKYGEVGCSAGGIDKDDQARASHVITLIDEARRRGREEEEKATNRVREITEQIRAILRKKEEHAQATAHLNTLRQALTQAQWELERVQAAIEDWSNEESKVEAEVKKERATVVAIEHEREKYKNETGKGMAILSTSVQTLGDVVRRLTEMFHRITEYESNSLEMERFKMEKEVAEKNRDEASKNLQLIKDSKLNVDTNIGLKRSQMETIEQALGYVRLISDINKMEAQIAALSDRINNSVDKDTVLRAQRTEQAAKLIVTEKATAEKYCSKDLDSQDQVLHGMLGAEHDYQQAQVKQTVLKLALDDVMLLSKSLDGALTEYHKSKLDDVNLALNDYWQEVYQGRDIQRVEIKTSEDSRKPGTTRRSYNYRVVMMKGDVELDMRGRCSMGQKALISLLIRLALSDTFALHCGVLALDEPTANLDQKNAEAFAASLAALIRRRQGSSRQLILITHDDTFVQRMRAMGCLESCYKVVKDSSQTSRLEDVSRGFH